MAIDKPLLGDFRFRRAGLGRGLNEGFAFAGKLVAVAGIDIGDRRPFSALFRARDFEVVCFS